MSIKINIEQNKCISPLECGKCMRVCIPAVFITYPTDRRKGKVCNKWLIEPTFKDRCTFCKKCEEICPRGAIKVVM